LREIEKDGVGDGEANGDPANLCAGDEADSLGGFGFANAPLRNGKGGVDDEAGTHAGEEQGGFDEARRGYEGDIEDYAVVDDDEDTADGKPGEVVVKFLHQNAIGHRRNDERDDVGKQADTCGQSLVDLHELKIDGDEVDGEEGDCGCGGGLAEEDDHFFGFHILRRKDPSFFGCEYEKNTVGGQGG